MKSELIGNVTVNILSDVDDVKYTEEEKEYLYEVHEKMFTTLRTDDTDKIEKYLGQSIEGLAEKQIVALCRYKFFELYYNDYVEHTKDWLSHDQIKKEYNVK